VSYHKADLSHNKDKRRSRFPIQVSCKKYQYDIIDALAKRHNVGLSAIANALLMRGVAEFTDEELLNFL